MAWMRSAYWISATFGPALSVPAGFTPDGLPVGMQIVGPLPRRLDRAAGRPRLRAGDAGSASAGHVAAIVEADFGLSGPAGAPEDRPLHAGAPASRRRAVDGCEWKIASTHAGGVLLGEVSAPTRRRMALMNAAALPVQVDGEAIGAALVRARQARGERRDRHERHRAADERHDRQRLTTVGRARARPSGPAQDRERAVRPHRGRRSRSAACSASPDHRSPCTWCASSCARITSISSSECVSSSVSDSRMRRVPPMPTSARVRLPRPVAEAPLEDAAHRRAAPAAPARRGAP